MGFDNGSSQTASLVILPYWIIAATAYCMCFYEYVVRITVIHGKEGNTLSYLHKSAALSEARLPCVSKIFYFCDESVVLDVETQLTHLVPSEGELLGGSTRCHRLQPLPDLAHVLRLPVLGVQDQRLALFQKKK